MSLILNIPVQQRKNKHIFKKEEQVKITEFVKNNSFDFTNQIDFLGLVTLLQKDKN